VLCKVNSVNRVIILCGDINEEMYSFFELQACKLEATSDAPIKISLNSQGGNPGDALAIAGRIKSSNHEYHINVFGACQSAALAIIAVCTIRRASRYALFMHHETSYTIKSETTSKHETHLKVERLHEKVFNTLLADHSDRTELWWTDVCRKKDVWITPAQCLKIKLIDEII